MASEEKYAIISVGGLIGISYHHHHVGYWICRLLTFCGDIADADVNKRLKLHYHGHFYHDAQEALAIKGVSRR